MMLTRAGLLACPAWPCRRHNPVLFSRHIVNHSIETFEIFNRERTAPLLDDTEPRQTIELARYRFAVCTCFGGNFCMGRCRVDLRDPTLSRGQPGEAQHFRSNPIADRKCT